MYKNILIMLMIAISIGTYVFFPSVKSTSLLDKNVKFDGIPTEKENTNIVIVHGIGDHCIGYADSLINSITSKYLGNVQVEMNHIPADYLKGAINKFSVIDVKNNATRTAIPQSRKIYPPRNGGCNIDTSNSEVMDLLSDPSLEIDGKKYLTGGEKSRTDKYDSYVYSQESMCDYLHRNDIEFNDGNIAIDCRLLYVTKNYEDYAGVTDKQRQYITGFIRKISIKLNAIQKITIFEVTWSPATRWIKTALHAPELLNNINSQAFLNKEIKNGIINSAIADAVAYLSDSGILINYNLLQAFCFTMESTSADSTNEKSAGEEVEFICDRDKLHQMNQTDYAKKNDTVLISHSLGTRVLFDTLGLMSYVEPQKTSYPNEEIPPDFVSIMYEKLNKIHAEVSDDYLDSSTTGNPSFSDLLKSRVPAFIDSVHSMFVFTNQIPLLSANLTSPLDPRKGAKSRFKRIDFGQGFSNLLKLRTNNTPINIVSFHDPDDILSYNLSCWFRTSVLRHNEKAKDIIEAEAIQRAEVEGVSVGDALRSLRESMFESCSLDKQDKYYQNNESILKLLWDTQKEEGFTLADASVRLSSGKLMGLLANPQEVHSNYFTDKVVHEWLLTGHN